MTDLEAVNHVDTYRPDVVINCAGLSSKELAEQDPTRAYKVNALGARNLAIASAAVGGLIVHLSTDDLYPGSIQHPVNEFDKTLPPTSTENHKAGEMLVRELNPRYHRAFLLGVHRPAHRPPRAHNRDEQKGRDRRSACEPVRLPTSSNTYANFVISVMESGEFGTFHASTEGLCSRYEFAKRALELAGVPTTNLVGKQDPKDAYRIELENLMIKMTGIFEMPRWEDDLKAYMTDHGMTA
ncbi:MAG: SDR family oxidoreductase [Slackia sp.]